MTIEALWYASYTPEKKWGGRIVAPAPPKCNRLTRLPRAEQLGIAFDLALDFRAGRAGCRAVSVTLTGETYWWWPRPNVKHGDWWMLPERTVKLMRRATDYAEHLATGGTGTGEDRDYVDVHLLRLRRRAHKAAAYARTAGVVLPPFGAPKDWRALRALQPPPKPDSHRLIAAQRARMSVLEQRYDLTPEGAAKTYISHPFSSGRFSTGLR